MPRHTQLTTRYHWRSGPRRSRCDALASCVIDVLCLLLPLPSGIVRAPSPWPSLVGALERQDPRDWHGHSTNSHVPGETAMPQAEWVTSSWALVMQTRALLRKTRDRIALNSRLNPWWGVSGSSDGVGDGALMRSVLDRLERGVLFPAPSRMWAGKGTGQICSVCAQTIHLTKSRTK